MYGILNFLVITLKMKQTKTFKNHTKFILKIYFSQNVIIKVISELFYILLMLSVQSGCFMCRAHLDSQ